ncbi:MAG: aminotransferase class I/II-fold pyridoxal phosphate-dependent enzyme [Acidobacteria bacterium]|nr:aminotransferase class I/II-fold pyridoxal phosphate-dependent enzyme [Acidobacteriota bacterium]
MSFSMSRRRFAGSVGAALGAALLPSPFGASRASAAPARGEMSDRILLDANENPYGPSASALDALGRAGRAAGRYPGALEDELRAKIAAHHGVSEDRIVLGCGSSDVLRMAGTSFLSPGRSLVAAEPTFEAVLSYATVLIDEAYHHFVENPAYRTAIAMIDRHPNVVVARTFSKIYGMAGLRVGYGVAAAANAATLKGQASWDNVNLAGLSIAIASLNDPELVPKNRRLLNDTRRWLCAQLDRDGRRYIPSETNFVMIHVGGDVAPLIRAFRDQRIQVGRKFPSLSDWLRVSIGTREETASFLTALQKIVPKRAAA